MASSRSINEDLDDEEDEDSRRLPAMARGDGIGVRKISAEQHFTEPPPRYSEASIIKKLEELGIGRPSTYVSVLSTIRDRGYVRLDKKRFIPEDKGRVVTAFLESFFSNMWNMASRQTSKNSSTASPTAKSTGAKCCANSGRISRLMWARSRTCASPMCWMR